MRQNSLQNPFAILQHLVVPEAKHLPPLARQISVTGLVARAFGVLRAVSLDNQLSANTKKVDNVGSKWNLSAKLESAQATIAQETPQAEFAVGRRASHRSGAGALVRRDACVSLHRSPTAAQRRMRALGSRLRKRPALRRQLLQQRRRLEIVAELGLKFLELG
jgi:hypothetical protein